MRPGGSRCSAGIAGGADVILIPEIPFRMESIFAKFRARERRGRPFSLVVVAEGAAPAGSDQVFQAEDAVTGWKRLGGVSFASLARSRSTAATRCARPSSATSSAAASPVPVDRILATRFGVEAARLAVEGGFGQMVALRCDEIVAVPLSDAIGHLKRSSPDARSCRRRKDVGIVFGDEDPADIDAHRGVAGLVALSGAVAELTLDLGSGGAAAGRRRGVRRADADRGGARPRQGPLPASSGRRLTRRSAFSASSGARST